MWITGRKPLFEQKSGKDSVFITVGWAEDVS